MSLRKFIKHFAGRKGNATHNGTPSSHVNHKANKRIAGKAARRLKTSEIFERQDYDKE